MCLLCVCCVCVCCVYVVYVCCVSLGWWMMEDTEDGKDVSLTMWGLESN